MKDFDFCSYTRFLFGKDADEKLGTVLKENGAETVMLLHDPGKFLYESGLLDRIMGNMVRAGLKVVEMGDVKPNPIIGYVEECKEMALKKGVNYLVALGGGSVIDTAKAVSAGMGYDGDLWDLFEGGPGKADPARKLPVAVVLTNPATGSESGYGCMIDNPELQVKGALTGAGNWLRPEICFMNPELTYSMPPRLTGMGIVDMFSHAAERYFSNAELGSLMDYMTEGLLRYLVENGHLALDDPKDYEARGNIMWAGSVAHNDTLGIGRGKDMGTHAIAQVLRALYDTPHGVTIAIIMPSWMRQVYKRDVKRFARYAEKVFGIENNGNDEETALKGIEATEKWFQEMRCPVGFQEAGLPTDELEKIAEMAGPRAGRCYPVEGDEILAIVKDAASR